MAHENTVRLEVYAGPNRAGEYHYALFWISDYHPGHPQGENRLAERGQHYLAHLPTDLPEHVQRVDLRGK